MLAPARSLLRLLLAAMLCAGLLVGATSTTSGATHTRLPAGPPPQLSVVGNLGAIAVSGAFFTPGGVVALRVYLCPPQRGQHGYEWALIGRRTVTATRDGLLGGVLFRTPLSATGVPLMPWDAHILASAVDRHTHREVSTINTLDYTLGL